jgi:hypothetical protein
MFLWHVSAKAKKGPVSLHNAKVNNVASAKLVHAFQQAII